MPLFVVRAVILGHEHRARLDLAQGEHAYHVTIIFGETEIGRLPSPRSFSQSTGRNLVYDLVQSVQGSLFVTRACAPSRSFFQAAKELVPGAREGGAAVNAVGETAVLTLKGACALDR